MPAHRRPLLADLNGTPVTVNAGGFWGALAYDLGSALHARLTSKSPEE